MALNPLFIGHTFPPSEPHLISREEIRSFADAIGDPNPVYIDPDVARAAGHPDVVAPPTFAAVLTQASFDLLAADADLELDYARMVHGDQTFNYRRPLVAGDRVSTTVSITDITVRRGTEFLTVRNEVTAAGEPVLTSTALLVIRPEEPGR